MSEMIERVADAIDAARYAHPTYPRERDRPFSEADRSDRKYAFRLARAAIEAMREPTEEMCARGWGHVTVALIAGRHSQLMALYRSMIDEALK